VCVPAGPEAPELTVEATGPRGSAGGDRLLTVGEVAAEMRVSNMTVYRLIRGGELAAIRVGRNYRIFRSALTAYLSERAVRVEGR
jgi:excisionase family DNA binding protein